MRLVKLEDITPEMELARTIYTEHDIPLLQKGCKHINRFTDKLRNKGIDAVYIKDEISKDIKLKEPVTEKTRSKSRQQIRQAVENLKQNNRIDISKVDTQITNIIEELITNKDLLAGMVKINNKDNYTFNHSVNVAILALKLGIALNYSQPKLKELGLGAMLHDIGKLEIDSQLLTKTGNLTKKEYETIQQHPSEGAKLVQNNYNLPATALHIIKYHHERINGSGYPEGKTSHSIHNFALITGIADVFDALTSNRPYRDRWSNKKALELIASKAGSEFDRNLVERFRQNIAFYPTGIKVNLSNGQTAIVKGQNNNFPQRPIIKVIRDSKGEDILPPKEINMLDKLNITIEEVVYPINIQQAKS
jgi:putative nucleotidyltransferase with HDIG domain